MMVFAGEQVIAMEQARCNCFSVAKSQAFSIMSSREMSIWSVESAKRTQRPEEEGTPIVREAEPGEPILLLPVMFLNGLEVEMLLLLLELLRCREKRGVKD